MCDSLDLLGLIPGTGDAIDVIHGTMHMADGDIRGGLGRYAAAALAAGTAFALTKKVDPERGSSKFLF